MPNKSPILTRLITLFSSFAILGLAHASTPVHAEDPAHLQSEEVELFFAFVTTLSGQKDEYDLDKEVQLPSLEDGQTITGADILDQLQRNDDLDGSVANSTLLKDHSLAAYFQHPASGKSVELQIGTCSTLDFATSEGPFTQQVQCGEDLYAYRAGEEGLEILRNGDVHFAMPLDAGKYLINGVAVVVK